MNFRHLMLAMLIKFIQRFSSKETVVRGTRYILSKNVFHPKYFYTSEFMAENMEIKEGSIVLDMGTGSGIIAIEASRKASIVVAVDVNPEAIEIARKNAEINGRNNIIFIKATFFLLFRQ
ncbi:MAG: methyltransferase [Thermoplasmata archaeon]|nr:MAG: methyltransferase [Thermoplasmata archaeon]